jgi:hypothetical protein
MIDIQAFTFAPEQFDIRIGLGQIDGKENGILFISTKHGDQSGAEILDSTTGPANRENHYGNDLRGPRCPLLSTQPQEQQTVRDFKSEFDARKEQDAQWYTERGLSIPWNGSEASD